MVSTATIAREPPRGPYPPRSKMLDVYASDVGRMLADGNYANAELAALAIPHIAVALADAGLQSSCAAYQDWCSKWIQPDFGASAYADWSARSRGPDALARGVPFEALRALRLRRGTRELSAPFLDAESESGLQKPHPVTSALLRGAFRWYEQEGRYHPTVQTNVARLGVLR
jgi:hypothetical protein